MPMPMPRRQGSLLLPAVAPPTLNLNSKKDSPIVSALNNAIDVVNIVHDLVPLEPGKGVLSTISSILGIVKNTIANQNDFAELADQCNRIGLVIWRATCGEQKEMSRSIKQALSELKTAVDGILEAVEKKPRKGLGSKVLHVKINRDLIVQWQQDLDRFLTLFNAELNISANLKLDELLALFEEFRSNLKTQTETSISEALPAKPLMFVGRDDLVKDAVKSLLTFHHVALIGPGGIGKTSIARAVVNDDAVSNKFSERRYFVRYDDMDASQITYATFLDRIALALGISSKANTHSLISNALSTSDILLVLDNAETFLDAEKDAGRIAESIDQFGARSNVSIMLTTRTSGLPPNLNWGRLRVPALEESAACAAFRMIYHPPIDSAILCKLLSSIDFHPLSINLLAQVAVQNEWSSKELVAAWDHQHALLLENGSGKIHSIAITVEMSLNSPSLKKLGKTVRHLLQVIAFLPQGISKTRLGAIFPSNLPIIQCAELLCKHSLAYHKGDFITMLAPIRLYISTQYNDSSPDRIPLLSGVLAYYNNQLWIEPVVKALIRAEDVNIEHVVAFRLSRSTERTMVQALIFTTNFVASLTEYKPRPIAFLPVVLAMLRPEDSVPTSFSCLNILKRGEKTALIYKGLCIEKIATLAQTIGQLGEAKELFNKARDIFIACGSAGRLDLKFAYGSIGEVCVSLGDFLGSEAALEACLRTRPLLLFFMSQTERNFEAEMNHNRVVIKMYRGDPGAVDLCLAGLKHLQDVKDFQGASEARVTAGYVELFSGKNENARCYFQAALEGFTEEKQHHVSILMGMAEVSYRQGHLTESNAFHQQVRDIIQGLLDADISYATGALSIMAAHTAIDGNIELARTQISALTAKISQSPDVKMVVNCFYLAASIELRGNDLRRAAELFLQTIEYCKMVSEVRTQARALRALGEIALLEKDVAAAKARFGEASTLCDFMGIQAKFLYIDHVCYMLSEDLEGWTLFQQGRLPTV